MTDTGSIKGHFERAAYDLSHGDIVDGIAEYRAGLAKAQCESAFDPDLLDDLWDGYVSLIIATQAGATAHLRLWEIVQELTS